MRDLGREVGQAVAEELGSHVQDAAGGIGKYIGQSLRDAIGGDTIDSVANTIGTAIDKVQTFKEGLHALRSGEITDGLKGLSETFHGILPDSFMANVDSVVNTFSDAHDTVKNTLNDFLDTGKELQNAFKFGSEGALAGLLSGAGELVSPLALLLAGGWAGGSVTLGPLIRHDFESWAYGDQGIPVPEHALGGLPESPILPRSAGAGVIPRLRAPMTPSSELPSFAPLDMPDDPKDPRNISRYASAPTIIQAPSGGTGSARVDAQQAVVEAGAATISAGSLSLGGLSLAGLMPQGASTATHSPSGWGSGTASAPSFASGFPTLPSAGLGHGFGRASGGIIPGDSPGYDNLLGSVGGTPIGLEGGEFVVNPKATQTHLGLLQAINSGFDPNNPTGGSNFNPNVQLDPGIAGPPDIIDQANNLRHTFPWLFKDMPDDWNPDDSYSDTNLPGPWSLRRHFDDGGLVGGILGGGTDVHQQGGVKTNGKPQSPGGVLGQKPEGVMPGAPQPQKDAGEPSQPQTIIPQGKGEGFGLQGGIIGAAEGAAATGANLFAPGSGAAVQIGMEEANRAIEYGVKAGITLGVEAPLDTFWLSDSGLSDPSHSWFGKLGLNLIGQTAKSLNLQNVAGQTQAPLTQGQQGSALGGKQANPSSPTIHIENQYNSSDVDHMNNNQTLAGQVAAHSMTSNSAYGYY